MNDTLNRNQESSSLEKKHTKKGCSCLSILSALFVIVIALIAALWILLMHTSFPLKYVANFVEALGKSSNLKINKISGSISSGISAEKITWNDGEISDMRFRYSGIMDVWYDKKLIIYEMHIGSAKIFTNSSKDSATETTGSESTNSEDTSIAHDTTQSPSDSILQLLQIDHLSLNKITIENRTTGKTINIPKIDLSNFKAEAGVGVNFGNLEADSDHLIIKTTDVSVADYQKKFEIELLPKLDKMILKPIKVEAFLGFKEEKEIVSIKAFDETLSYEYDSTNKRTLTFHDTNFTDYLDIPLPNQINLDAWGIDLENGDSALTIGKGTLALGMKTFEIQPIENETIKVTVDEVNLDAIYREGETEIRYQAPFNHHVLIQVSKANLSSTPEMSPENLISYIYHNQKFSELDATQQQKMRKYMEYFTFDK